MRSQNFSAPRLWHVATAPAAHVYVLYYGSDYSVVVGHPAGIKRRGRVRSRSRKKRGGVFVFRAVTKMTPGRGTASTTKRPGEKASDVSGRASQ